MQKTSKMGGKFAGLATEFPRRVLVAKPLPRSETHFTRAVWGKPGGK